MVRRSNVIAVMSSKGGVGKTVTTANIAAALSTEFNKKVLVIDTNVSTASLGLHLDILYPEYTIHDIVDKKVKNHEFIHHYNSNLHVIPASIKLNKNDKDINKFRTNVQNLVDEYDKLLSNLHEKYDFILLDCAPGIDVESIATMNVAGALLLIANPEYPAIASIAKTVEYAKLLKMPIGGMILTQIKNQKHELSAKEIEEALQVKIIQQIPYDDKISKSIAFRTPIVLHAPFNKSSIAYKKVAGIIAGKKYNQSLFGKMRTFMQ